MIDPKIYISILNESIRKWGLILEADPYSDSDFNKLIRAKIQDAKDEIKEIVRKDPDKII